MNTNEQKPIDWKACEAFWSDVTESFVCPIQMDGYAFDVSHTERTTIEEAKAISEKIVRAVNSYEPMQQRIKELEEAAKEVLRFKPSLDYAIEKEFNAPNNCLQSLSKLESLLQSSKQL